MKHIALITIFIWTAITTPLSLIRWYLMYNYNVLVPSQRYADHGEICLFYIKVFLFLFVVVLVIEDIKKHIIKKRELKIQSEHESRVKRMLDNRQALEQKLYWRVKV